MKEAGKQILLGFAVGTGEPVYVPLRHMVITGQTQEAGKTTALEGMISRSGARAVCFVTKRGEGTFANARRTRPYFREQADWQFVASVLEASRSEKMRFERAWIIRASQGCTTLSQVHANVRRLMDKFKTGLNADVYLTLNAYLDVVVPQIVACDWADSLELLAGVNAVDLTAIDVEMQHLVIKSSIDWVLKKEDRTIVVVPEAWKFIPQGRGTPVKLSAEAYIRQAAGLGNYLWLDSQDIAGVDKTILKSVPLWILGVQRESNEVKRTLEQIPAGIRKPKADQIATLKLGEFYACWGTNIVHVYAQPAWMEVEDAVRVARGELEVGRVPRPARPRLVCSVPPSKVYGTSAIAEEFAKEMEEVVDKATEDRIISGVAKSVAKELAGALAARPGRHDAVPMTAPAPNGVGVVDEEALYQRFKARLAEEAPALIKLACVDHEIEIKVERRKIETDQTSLRGMAATLLFEGYFDDGKGAADAWREAKRRWNYGGISARMNDTLDALTELGFVTKEGTEKSFLYRAVPIAKKRITTT